MQGSRCLVARRGRNGERKRIPWVPSTIKLSSVSPRRGASAFSRTWNFEGEGHSVRCLLPLDIKMNVFLE